MSGGSEKRSKLIGKHQQGAANQGPKGSPGKLSSKSRRTSRNTSMAIIEEGKEISLIEEASIDEENNEEFPKKRASQPVNQSQNMYTIEEEKRDTTLLMEVEDYTIPDKSNGDQGEDEERRRILLRDKQLPNSLSEAQVINTESSYSSISYDYVQKSNRINTMKFKKSAPPGEDGLGTLTEANKDSSNNTGSSPTWKKNADVTEE